MTSLNSYQGLHEVSFDGYFIGEKMKNLRSQPAAESEARFRDDDEIFHHADAVRKMPNPSARAITLSAEKCGLRTKPENENEAEERPEAQEENKSRPR